MLSTFVASFRSSVSVRGGVPGGAGAPAGVGNVTAYTSTTATLAGFVPSVFVAGTVNWRSTDSPRRSATRSAGGTGSLTSGGSGGPFLPQPQTTINAKAAK